MKRERDPSPEEFEALLAWLDPDPNAAGIKLTQITARLIRIFVSRGCIDAESLADEVLNRVAVRIHELTKTYSDPLRCCQGFADNVYREYLREQRKINTLKPPPPPRPAEELEREDECLRGCLSKLSEADRDLFIRYFRGHGRARIDDRKEHAAELGITVNALRIKACHIRKRVRQCLEECLDEK